MTRFVHTLGTRLLAGCEETGSTLMLLGRSLRECRHAPENWHRIFVQMKRIGNDTLLIAAAMAVFTGMVLGMHSGYTLSKFNAEQAIAPIVALGMIKEMGPVLTAMLLAGRIGASIAAEIGTMQINEEIDALHTLGISPVRYLAMPRFLGSVVMLPALVLCSSAVGILGGATVASAYFDIGLKTYFDTAFDAMEKGDLVECVIKAVCFGTIVAVIACRRGFSTRGGAEGVGRAITSCVVSSFVCIFICNYFVTRFMI